MVSSPNNSTRQFSGHANVNVAATPKLDIGTSLNFVKLNNHFGTDGGVSSMLGAEFGHVGVFTAARGSSPISLRSCSQSLYDNTDDANRFTGSITFNHRPMGWFSHRFIAGIDFTSDNGKSLERFAPPVFAAFLSPTDAAGLIAQVLRQNTVLTADYSGTATFNLSSSLKSASSIGGQFYRTQTDTSFLGGKDFPRPVSRRYPRPRRRSNRVRTALSIRPSARTDRSKFPGTTASSSPVLCASTTTAHSAKTSNGSRTRKLPHRGW